MGMRGASRVLAVATAALVAGSLIAPAAAASRSEMREALLTERQINELFPRNSGVLTSPTATRTTASYSTWELTGSGRTSVTSVNIAHVGRGKARPRDVTPWRPDGWRRISRTDNRLVQYSAEAFSTGEAIRVVLFSGRYAVSAVCEQVSSGTDVPVVPRRQLRTCATDIATAQMDKLQRLVK